MLQISNLSKSYGPQTLFDEVSFSIDPGERIGLIGRNGHGKSTLFKLLLGEENPDSGDIHIPIDYQIGSLSQHLKFDHSDVLAVVEECLPLLDDSWKETYKAEAILDGLGFTETELATPVEDLSGGFQVRLNLAKLLVSEPNLLLLDEPTNYLDIVSLRWLKDFLDSWPGELLLITHDRGFMNSVITHTLGIHRQNVRKIDGKIDKYEEQVALEEEVTEQARLNQEKKVKKTEEFVNRFRAKASKAKAVQSRVKALERMKTYDKLQDIEELDFRFRYAPFPGKLLLSARDLAFHYPEQDELLFEDVSFDIKPEDRIAVIGKNGKGKSTLLSLIAESNKPLQGEIKTSPNLNLGYFGQTNIQRLDPTRTIEDELIEVAPDNNRTAARSVAGLMMFEGDTALKKVSVLSGGEKSRVLLGKILLTPSNLLLLDEPSNHLDMQSNQALLEAIDSFPGAVIFVSHSEEFLDQLANRLIIFNNGGATVFEGGYQEFIRRGGWENFAAESEASNADGKSSGQNLSKKELRQKRAEVQDKKTEALGGRDKEQARVEKEISAIEAEVASLTKDLVDQTADGFGDAAAKLSRDIGKRKKSCDQLYERLETLGEEIDKISEEFDKELARLS